jgi:hypothetical protein
MTDARPSIPSLMRVLSLAMGLMCAWVDGPALANQVGLYDEITNTHQNGILDVSATTPIYVRVTTPAGCDFGVIKIAAKTCSASVEVLTNGNIEVEFAANQMTDNAAPTAHLLRSFFNVSFPSDPSGSIGCPPSEGGTGPSGFHCMDPDFSGTGLVSFSQMTDTDQVRTYTLAGTLDHPLRWPSLFGANPIVKSNAYASTITVSVTPLP